MAARLGEDEMDGHARTNDIARWLVGLVVGMASACSHSTPRTSSREPLPCLPARPSEGLARVWRSVQATGAITGAVECEDADQLGCQVIARGTVLPSPVPGTLLVGAEGAEMVLYCVSATSTAADWYTMAFSVSGPVTVAGRLCYAPEPAVSMAPVGEHLYLEHCTVSGVDDYTRPPQRDDR